MVSALMLTVVRAWILPEAETMASRSRVCTFSMVTGLPGVRFIQTLPATAPPSTTTATTPMMTFFPVDTYEPPAKAALHGADGERNDQVAPRRDR